MPSLVAFHAHPDDESSKGAATVARLVAAGYRAVLVTATGGEAGDILNPAMDRPDVVARLAAVRREELGRAAAIIGYDRVIELGYRDSGMPGSPDNAMPEAFANADASEVLGRIVAIVRSERPDVFMGYDSHERYPHPDHLKVHEITVRLAAAAASPQEYPDAGAPWRIPLVVAPIMTRRKMAALHDAMEARGLDSHLGGRLEGLQDEDLRRTVRVNVAGWVEQGREALRAHATQVDPNGFWFKVPTRVVEDVYPYEDFEVLHAEAGALEASEPFEA